MNKYQPAIEVMLREYCREEERLIKEKSALTTSEKLTELLEVSPLFQRAFTKSESFLWSDDRKVVTADGPNFRFIFDGDHVVVFVGADSFQVQEYPGRTTACMITDGYVKRGKVTMNVFAFRMSWSPTTSWTTSQCLLHEVSRDGRDTLSIALSGCRRAKQSKQFAFWQWRQTESIHLLPMPEKHFKFRADLNTINVSMTK